MYDVSIQNILKSLPKLEIPINVTAGSATVPGYGMIMLLVGLADFNGATSNKYQITS